MTTSLPQVYTAGAITWANEHYAGWRSDLEHSIEDITFLHPTETINEYEAHRRAGCVTEDIDMVGRSNGVIALISKPEQIGTVTEVVHAVNANIPVLLIITPPQWDYDKEQELPYEIGTPLDYHSSEYWFLVNYLLGDQDVDLPDGNVLQGWDGYGHSRAWVATRSSISELAAEWIDDVIRVPQ